MTLIPRPSHNPFNLRVMLCCLLLVALQTAAAGGSVTGRPAQIISGDELVLLESGGGIHRVRLSGIKAHPPNQPWGAAARRHLQALVLGRSVTLYYRSTEQTPEVRGQLKHGGADINIRMLSAGLAWLDPAGLSPAEVEEYAAAEQRAQAAGLGIWSDVGREAQPRSIRVPGGPQFRIRP